MGTWGDFAADLLAALGAPDTQDNMDALLTWFNAEQPPDSPNGAYNPLNIQAGDYAHTGTSGTGQYDFASWADGVAQTAAFLRQGVYSGIVAALMAGNDPVGVLEAVQDSPWASGHYDYALTGELAAEQANRARYLAGIIAGEGGPTSGKPAPGSGRGGSGGCHAPFTL